MTKEIYEKIEQLWEKHRLSGRKKLWKIDIMGQRELNSLIGELIREGKKEFAQYLKGFGIINLDAPCQEYSNILDI